MSLFKGLSLKILVIAILAVKGGRTDDDILPSNSTETNNLNAELGGVYTRLNTLDIKDTSLKVISNCTEAFANPQVNRGSGVYNIQCNGNSPFEVYCMADPEGGLPWTIVQRRVDGSVDFYRNWTEYQRGFGDLNKNFFIGLDKLHLFSTQCEPHELWVKLTDPQNVTKNAYYDRFAIGNKAEKYPLKVLGKYSGDAGDSLTYHKFMKFTTYDNDNDLSFLNCAKLYESAWWFKICHQSQLNGVYGSEKYGGGLQWYHFRGQYESMRYAHMAIRPARNSQVISSFLSSKIDTHF